MLYDKNTNNFNTVVIMEEIKDNVYVIDGIMYTEEGLANMEESRIFWRKFMHNLMFKKNEK